MQMFAALLWISEYLPEATVQPFAKKLKVLRFASDHSWVQEYFKTNYSSKIRKKLDTYFKFNFWLGVREDSYGRAATLITCIWEIAYNTCQIIIYLFFYMVYNLGIVWQLGQKSENYKN